MSSPDTRNKNAMQDFLNELRTHNSFFKSISADTALDLLKRCEILIFENEFIYRKGDSTDTCLLVLYGNIALHSTEAGVFKEGLMGDTISEENILLENQVLRYILSFPSYLIHSFISLKQNGNSQSTQRGSPTGHYKGTNERPERTAPFFLQSQRLFRNHLPFAKQLFRQERNTLRRLSSPELIVTLNLKVLNNKRKTSFPSRKPLKEALKTKKLNNKLTSVDFI